MTSNHISRWVQDWGPLIALTSAVLLTLVTAWLAWVTMRMAKGAKDAAEYSKIAAEASLAATASIQASAPVEFALSPARETRVRKTLELLNDMVSKDASRAEEEVDISLFDPILTITAIQLVCDGSAVYVPGGRIVEVCRETRRDVIECQATQITLATASVALPRRLHKGESIKFNLAGFEPGERIVRIRAVIDYSFIGQNPVQERLVVWRGGPQKGTVKSIETRGLGKSDR
jgi:hypothetical protein